ncbi:MAG: helix-turn-helix transcriptional regulator [Armatimonadetes bacterium]|nr:helix-turn-helix transcriptional regulator [Armatimonadota bacterium]
MTAGVETVSTTIHRFAPLAAALSDLCRLRILLVLKQGELCTCHLTELLGVAPSTTSKHLSILKNAQLLQCRREGRWVHYRLCTRQDGAPEEVLEAIDWVSRRLGQSDVARRDAVRMKEILAMFQDECD